MFSFFSNPVVFVPLVVLVCLAVIRPLRNFFFQLLFGVVYVPEHCIGLMIKKYTLGGARLPEGRIIACNGEAGYQARTLAPGLHFGLWPWQYDIKLQELITVPNGQICLISAKDGKELPNGQLLARYEDCNLFQDSDKFMQTGCKGKQTKFLTAGRYRINTLLFDCELVESTKVWAGKVGIVTVKDGAPLTDGAIAGIFVEGHNKFQDPDMFLKNGGQRGLQSDVILSGEYYLNPWFASVTEDDMTEVPIGNVGVIVSFFGKEGVDVSGDSFTQGNLVKKGEKGVCVDALEPGRYPLNTKILKVEIVPTTNIVLNWANARTESHQLDANLCTISVRSKDGFKFNLDVSQIIHIPMKQAPMVIARFGNMKNLVSQVLEPTIGNYFRNSAQGSDVIAFLNDRVTRQDESKKAISAVLAMYNVNAVDTLINDITPPEDLMKTLTDRKLAQEINITYEQRIIAEKTRQELEKNTNLANIQGQIVTAEQGVIIANKNADAAIKTAEGEKQSVQLRADAKSYQTAKEAEGQANATKALAMADAAKITAIGEAEAGKIQAIGKATSEAYEGQVKAIGQNNLAKMKVIETIATNKLELTPKVLVAGGDGGGGVINSMLGLKILEDLELGLLDNKKTNA